MCVTGAAQSVRMLHFGKVAVSVVVSRMLSPLISEFSPGTRAVPWFVPPSSLELVPPGAG